MATPTADLDAETDFTDTSCEDFDLTAFEAIAAGAIEPTVALAAANVDSRPGVIHCQYTSDSGMTLDITVVTAFAGLNAEPGAFETAEALDLADTMAGQVLERFDAYR